MHHQLLLLLLIAACSHAPTISAIIYNFISFPLPDIQTDTLYSTRCSCHILHASS